MMDKLPVCECDTVHDDVVAEVRAKMPGEVVMYDLADFFKVLGDSTRVRIMWALDMREMCVCDLAALLGVTKSAVSHQLRSLKSARLVKYRRDGKNTFYSLDDQHVADIFEKALEHLGHND